jgi:hypothetical protein
MKATALVITAAASLALAACGSGAKQTAPKRGSEVITFTAPTTTAIANPTTGQAMRCTNQGISAGAYVPSAGHGVANASDGTKSSALLNLTRDNDGSLAVSCSG